MGKVPGFLQIEQETLSIDGEKCNYEGCLLFGKPGCSAGRHENEGALPTCVSDDRTSGIPDNLESLSVGSEEEPVPMSGISNQDEVNTKTNYGYIGTV
jgi:hypothetical protein